VIFPLFDLLTSVFIILTCSIPHLKLPNITYRTVYSLLRCEPYKRREVSLKSSIYFVQLLLKRTVSNT